MTDCHGERTAAKRAPNRRPVRKIGSCKKT